MATGKSTQYPADQESTENPSVIRSTNNKFIRRMGDERRASDWVPRQIAPKNMMIDGRNAESSLVDINQFKWEKKTKRFLLDSCADMHICNDPGAFLTFGPPDLAQVGVGKAGEYVKFEGMGTIVIGMAVEHASGEKSAMGLLIEKAYKPMPGHSSTNIISTGRIFEMQSVEFWPNATNRLVLGEYHHDFSLQNFSPYILAAVPMKSESNKQVNVHITGVPRHTTLRAAHLRLGHASWKWVATVFGIPSTRTCTCHICLIFKARAPSPTVTPKANRASQVGARVSLDAWKYTTPATITGWFYILGAVDEATDLFDVEATKEPNGKTTSEFLVWLVKVYRSEYGVEIRCLRLDNGSIYDCDEFRATAAYYHIRLEFSAPYFHFQLRIERHWQTMKRDAACMLATACRPKTWYIYACLHAAMLRCVMRQEPETALEDDESDTMSAYTRASGKEVSLEAYRIWGAVAYGFLMQEQRKAMSLDKADPVAVYGAYIGNYREQATFKILTSTGKIVAMGAAMIDEKTLLKKMPTRESDPNEFIELEEEVRDGTKIYSYDGKTSGPVTDSRVQVCPNVEAGEQAADEAARVTQPAALTRPLRQLKPAIRYDPA